MCEHATATIPAHTTADSGAYVMLKLLQNLTACQHKRLELIREEPMYDPLEPSHQIAVRHVKKCVRCGTVMKSPPRWHVIAD